MNSETHYVDLRVIRDEDLNETFELVNLDVAKFQSCVLVHKNIVYNANINTLYNTISFVVDTSTLDKGYDEYVIRVSINDIVYTIIKGKIIVI